MWRRTQTRPDDLARPDSGSATPSRRLLAGEATRVWPWIAQLGQGRGGFYSYDFLENLIGCDIHSADRIVPEWQQVKVGDEVRLAAQGPYALEVASLTLRQRGAHFEVVHHAATSESDSVKGAAGEMFMGEMVTVAPLSELEGRKIED